GVHGPLPPGGGRPLQPTVRRRTHAHRPFHPCLFHRRPRPGRPRVRPHHRRDGARPRRRGAPATAPRATGRLTMTQPAPACRLCPVLWPVPAPRPETRGAGTGRFQRGPTMPAHAATIPPRIVDFATRYMRELMPRIRAAEREPGAEPCPELAFLAM